MIQEINMNKKEAISVGIIITMLIITAVYLSYLILNEPPIKTKEDIILEKIENLEKQIKTIENKRDSIRIIMGAADKKIINNEKHYKETVNNIISQPNRIDSIFARNYIQKYIDERIR